MLKGKTIWIAGVVCALVLFPSTAVLADDDDDDGNPEKIQGVWYNPDVSNGAGALILITGTVGGRYIIEWWRAGPPIIGVLGEEMRTVHTGPVKYEGHGQWSYTILSFIQDEEGSIILTATGSGRLELESDDLLHLTGDFCIYTNDQEPFGEDPPTYGCYPDYIDKVYTRVPLTNVLE